MVESILDNTLTAAIIAGAALLIVYVLGEG